MRDAGMDEVREGLEEEMWRKLQYIYYCYILLKITWKHRLIGLPCNIPGAQSVGRVVPHRWCRENSTMVSIQNWNTALFFLSSFYILFKK